MTKKYIIVFLKNRLRIIFITSTFFFLLFLFVLLFNKNTAYTPIFALWVYVSALIWYGVDILLSIRFQHMIKYQEKYLNVVFSDADSISLFPTSMTYLSDDWLIFCGKAAFHRQYITKVVIKRTRSNMGNDYRLTIQTCDGKNYTRAIDSYANARKIQNWFNSIK